MQMKVTETKYVDSAKWYFSTKMKSAEDILHPQTKHNITVKENK